MHRFSVGRSKIRIVSAPVVGISGLPGLVLNTIYAHGSTKTYTYTLEANGVLIQSPAVYRTIPPLTLQWYLPREDTHAGYSSNFDKFPPGIAADPITITSLPYSGSFTTPPLTKNNYGTYTLYVTSGADQVYQVGIHIDPTTTTTTLTTGVVTLPAPIKIESNTIYVGLEPEPATNVQLTPLFDAGNTLTLSFTPGSLNTATAPTTLKYGYKITTSNDPTSTTATVLAASTTDLTSAINIAGAVRGTPYYAHANTQYVLSAFLSGTTINPGAWGSSTTAAVACIKILSSDISVTGSANSSGLSFNWSTSYNGGQGPNSWDYTLYNSVNGSPTTAVSSVTNSSVSSASFNTSLVSGSYYQLGVIANNNAGSSLMVYSAPILFAPLPVVVFNPSTNSASAEITFSWVGSVNGGGVITYAWRLYNVTTSAWVDTISAYSAATTKTYIGLTNGSKYRIEVTPKTAIASGSPTLSADIVCIGAPAQMSSPLWTNVDANNISLSWTQPASNGSSINGYVVDVYNYTYATLTRAQGTFFKSFTIVGSGTLSKTFNTADGLVPGSWYVAYVRATTLEGFVPAFSSSSSAKIYAAPEPPTGLSWTSPNVNNSTITVNWTAPATNGTTIAKYEFAVYSGAGSTYNYVSTVFTSAATPTAANIAGLTGGTTYKVFIRALTSSSVPGGWSDVSSNVVAGRVPQTISAGALLYLDSTNNKLACSASCSDNGGAAVTQYNYTIQSSANNSSWTYFTSGTTTASAFDISGLVSNTYYRLVLTASNIIGTSTEATTGSQYYAAYPAPTNGGVTATSSSLTFNVSGANRYSSSSSYSSASAFTSPLVLTNLASASTYTRYFWYVYGNNFYSAMATISGTTLTNPPPTPNPLVVQQYANSNSHQCRVWFFNSFDVTPTVLANGRTWIDNGGHGYCFSGSTTDSATWPPQNPTFTSSGVSALTITTSQTVYGKTVNCYVDVTSLQGSCNYSGSNGPLLYVSFKFSNAVGTSASSPEVICRQGTNTLYFPIT
jgi:hypothetical protein